MGTTMGKLSPNLIDLDINDEYNIEITGFGDIYEVVSVRVLMKRLKKRHGGGLIYLCSNSEHGGRGMSLEGLEAFVRDKNGEVAEKGFVDVPPWRSRPRAKGTKNPLIRYETLNRIAGLVSLALVPLERFTRSKKRTHMVYCFFKTGKEK